MALALAKEYGKQGAMEEALKDWQGQNGYRQTDIADVVRNVLSKPEIIDAEFESIDAVVEYQPKPSMLKVAAKGTANLARKMHASPMVLSVSRCVAGEVSERVCEKTWR